MPHHCNCELPEGEDWFLFMSALAVSSMVGTRNSPSNVLLNECMGKGKKEEREKKKKERKGKWVCFSKLKVAFLRQCLAHIRCSEHTHQRYLIANLSLGWIPKCQAHDKKCLIWGPAMTNTQSNLEKWRRRNHLFSVQRCQAFMSLSTRPLQVDGCQGNHGAKPSHSWSFPLIIANVNECWLALYACLACKSTLIGCAKIEEKVICPFKTTDREMKCCLGLYCYNFADKITMNCLLWMHSLPLLTEPWCLSSRGGILSQGKLWWNVWSSFVEIHFFFSRAVGRLVAVGRSLRIWGFRKGWKRSWLHTMGKTSCRPF